MLIQTRSSRFIMLKKLLFAVALLSCLGTALPTSMGENFLGFPTEFLENHSQVQNISGDDLAEAVNDTFADGILTNNKLQPEFSEPEDSARDISSIVWF